MVEALRDPYSRGSSRAEQGGWHEAWSRAIENALIRNPQRMPLDDTEAMRRFAAHAREVEERRLMSQFGQDSEQGAKRRRHG